MASRLIARTGGTRCVTASFASSSSGVVLGDLGRPIARSHFRDLVPSALRSVQIGRPVLPFSRFLSSSTSSTTSPPYYAAIDLDAEMERFTREMQHDDGQSTQRPRVSSPTRLAGMLVAAGNAGRADILHRALELIDQSADASTRGILLILLAQFVRLNDVKALQHLIERLADIDEQGEAGMAKPQRAEQQQDKETASEVDDVLHALHEEMEEEGSTTLARPYAYIGAYRALLAEHARTRDVPAILHTLDLLNRSAIKADASMRTLVRGVLEKVGVRPFLAVLQRRGPQLPAGGSTTPTTRTPQRAGSAYQPHPDTLGFLVRCMSAMVSERTLTPQVLPDAYRLATLATQLLKKSACHGAGNFAGYRSLLQFYRAAGVKPAIEDLLLQFDQHKVVVTSAIMELALPGLRLAQLDRVLKTLREKKNPVKPSPAHYMRVAQAIHFQETIPDFLNVFVGNYKVDHPGREIEQFILNRALLSFCKALHLGKATAIFNLMHPHTARLSYSTHTEGLPERLCEAGDDTYVIYMNMLDKIADLSRKGQVEYIKQPIPSQEEVVTLAKQAYGIALQTVMIPPYDVFASMLSLYVGAKQIGLADVVFSQMKEAGHDPKPEHYRQLIEGFRAVGNQSAAQNLQREMQRRHQSNSDRDRDNN